MKQKIIRLSQILVLAAALVFISYSVYTNWAQILRYSRNVDIGILALGILLIPVQMLIKRFAWTRVIKKLGEDLDFYTSMRLISMFQVGSYIPGGVWHFVGISYWGEEEGIAKKKTFYATAINAMINLSVGLTVFVVLGIYLFTRLGPLRYFAGFIAVLGLVIFLKANIYFKIINILLGIINKGQLDRRLKTKETLEIGLIQLVGRLIEGLSFFILIYSIQPIDFNLVIPVIAISAGSWALGFLVFFMPSGAGVKEVSLIYMLGLIIPGSIAVLISVITRILYMIWEIAIALAFTYLDRGSLR